VGKPKHPKVLWGAVISGTAVTALLASAMITQPDVDHFGDPSSYTAIYQQPQIEPWGSHPVDTYVERLIASMTLEQKIRSLIIANQPGTDPGSLQSFVAGNDLG
jgi:hypothetical protein